MCNRRVYNIPCWIPNTVVVAYAKFIEPFKENILHFNIG